MCFILWAPFGVIFCQLGNLWWFANFRMSPWHSPRYAIASRSHLRSYSIAYTLCMRNYVNCYWFIHERPINQTIYIVLSRAIESKQCNLELVSVCLYLSSTITLPKQYDPGDIIKNPAWDVGILISISRFFILFLTFLVLSKKIKIITNIISQAGSRVLGDNLKIIVNTIWQRALRFLLSQRKINLSQRLMSKILLKAYLNKVL